MSSVTGPVNTLPGHRHNVPEGTKCDNHPDIDAIVRVQGATDSFGSEQSDLCQECLEQYSLKPGDHSGICDWCSCHSDHLRPRRDYEEGMGGIIYDVCDTCIGNQVHDAVQDFGNTEEDIDCEDDRDTEHDVSNDDEEEEYRHPDEDSDNPRPLNFNNPRGRW